MDTTLVFDYDGTIHNNMVIYEAAFRKCHEDLIRRGIIAPETVSRERLSEWFGMTAREMWLDFHPELPESVREEAALTIGRELVELIRQHKAVWYEGAKEMLNTLKDRGFSMVILSNCRRISADAQWAEFQLGTWFGKWYDAESYSWIPKADIIQEVQKENPGRLIVIGDRHHDLEAARAADALFVACMYGFAQPGELDSAKYRAYSVSEIPDIIQSCLQINA